MDLLDWVIADLVITGDEERQLEQLAEDIGLSSHEVEDAHRQYVDDLITAALRDGVIDDNERHLITSVATELRVPQIALELPPTPEHSPASELAPGSRICFTGAVIDADGLAVSRAELAALAESSGFVAVRSVTKKGCDVLVAADASTQSGKASKARQYGIPVMSAASFLATLTKLPVDR